MKKKTFKGDAFEAIHASAKALHNVGSIDKATMRNFEATCLIPAPKISTYRLSNEKNLFDNYKICPTLDAKHTCIVVGQYSQGIMIKFTMTMCRIVGSPMMPAEICSKC